jgi:carbon-monoxide dehydrogenase medium subunit
VKAPSFQYVAAKTIADASAALATHGAATAAIAGGQSLLPMLNLRVALPDLVVGLGGLDELKEVSVSQGSVRIGALTTHAEIEDGLFAEAFGGLLQRVASKISYRAIRHHGTIGGSVALADPAADWPGCLMALGATVRISGLKGPRSEPVESFVQGQYQTSLAPDEIIVGFDVPRPAGPLRWGVFKVARKSGAFANSMAFAVSQADGGRTIRNRVFQIPAMAVIFGFSFFLKRFLPPLLQFLRGTVAGVSLSFFQEPVYVLTVKMQPVGLIHRPLVPIQPQPGHAVEDGIDGVLGGPDLVRVFDAEDEFSSRMPRQEPVEKGRAGAADVQKPRRAGGKTNDYFIHKFISPFLFHFHFCFILRF